MSFMSFTKYPHGGFMMCESISEVDPNVAPPDTPVDVVGPEKSETVVNNMLSYHGDYVLDQLNKLGTLYHSEMEPLMSHALKIESVEERREFANVVSDKATIVCDTLREMIVSSTSMHTCVSSPRYQMASVACNAKMLLQCMPDIRKKGYSTASAHIVNHPVFYSWGGSILIRAMLRSMDVMDDRLYQLQSVKPLVDNDFHETLVTMFDDATDMFHVLFDDHARLERQNVIDLRTYNINHLLREALDQPGNEAAKVDCGYDCTDRELVTGFTNKTAQVVQLVRQKMYDLIASTHDPDDGVDYTSLHQKCFYYALTQLTNLFLTCTLYLTYIAYDIRNAISTKRSIDNLIMQISQNVLYH